MTWLVRRWGGEGENTYKDDLEEHLLVDLHELLVPLIDVGGLLAGVGVVILGCRGVAAVMGAPLDDLLHDGFVDLAALLARAPVKG